MKRIFLSMLSLMLVLGISATADYELISDDKGKKITNLQSNAIVLNGYKNGILSYSNLFEVQNGVAVIGDDLTEFDELRAWDMKNDFQKVIHSEQAQSPQPTESPSVSKYPSVYGSEANAIYSPSLVNEVQSTIQDGETGYTVKYFFTGEERSIFIPDTITITAACDAYSDVIGKDLSAIEKGDVVYIDKKMNGSVRTVALICRAPRNNIFLTDEDYGVDMEKYFSQNRRVANAASWKVTEYSNGILKSDNQYAFGLVGRRDGQMLYLMNKSGSIKNALRIPLTDDTIVYSHDVSSRGEQLIEKISAITSNISRKEWNEGSDIAYSNDNAGSYALVRLVDGKATDIIYYCGY